MNLYKEDIERLDLRKRAALINSLSGFKSLNLIGTTGENGTTNLAIFNSVIHLGSNPPLLGFIVRPESQERHTLENILKTSYFTINHVQESMYKKAHQTSAKYPQGMCEFEQTGLHKEYKDNFIAPFVQESNIQLGMKFMERINIDINQTILIISEIQSVYFPSVCWTEDGYLDIEKAGSLAGSSLDGYHTTKRLDRLAYARPQHDKEPLQSVYLKK